MTRSRSMVTTGQGLSQTVWSVTVPLPSSLKTSIPCRRRPSMTQLQYSTSWPAGVNRALYWRAPDAVDEAVICLDVLAAMQGLGEHGAVERDVRCQGERAACPLARVSVSVGVGVGGTAIPELPGWQRHDAGQRGEYPVPEVRGHSPGSLQDGDVVDQSSRLAGQDRRPGELALIQDSVPEQDEPLIIAYLIGVFELIDDAGSRPEIPQRAFLAVQVFGQGWRVVGNVLGEESGHRGAIAPFGRLRETMRDHSGLLSERGRSDFELTD